MLVAKGNKKNFFFFYFCLFFLLSTVNFSNSKNENKRIFFSINKIQINGNIRLDKNILLENLNKLYGQSIFKLNTDEIKTELFKFNLIKSIKIKKYYPNKIEINLDEVEFVAIIVKNNTKYFLADNQNLVLFNGDLNIKRLPKLYGINAEKFFLNFKKKLENNNFNLNLIENYYYFQINRWDLYLKNNLIIKFPTENVEQSILLVKKLIDNKEFLNSTIIDLRIKEKMIIKNNE
jgi:cell division protein FtsQ